MERSRGKGGKAVPLTTHAKTVPKTLKVPAKCPEHNGSSLKFDFLNKTRYIHYNNPAAKAGTAAGFACAFPVLCHGKTSLCSFGGER
jgi:hypothetical protein